MFITNAHNFLRCHRRICARAVLLGVMSSVASMRRPSAADVKPGSELYKRIVRALRGEYQWRGTSCPSGAGKGLSVLNEHHAHTVANETQFNTNCSEILPNVEVPPINKPYNGVGQACTATVENEQVLEAATDELSASLSTNSTMMSTGLFNGQDIVATSTPVTVLLGNYEAPAVQCSVAQKLQKISQVDKTHSTKPKPQSKYKPPYKIERNHKPSIIVLSCSYNKLLLFLL